MRGRAKPARFILSGNQGAFPTGVLSCVLLVPRRQKSDRSGVLSGYPLVAGEMIGGKDGGLTQTRTQASTNSVSTLRLSSARRCGFESATPYRRGQRGRLPACRGGQT